MRLLSVAIVSLVLAGVQAAQASIIVTSSNNPSSSQENVLLDMNSSGTTILGTTNQSKTQVSFTSSSSLTSSPQGQALIQGPSSGFSNMQIKLSNGGTFTSLIFALTLVGNGTSCTNCVSFSSNANEPGGGTSTAQGGFFGLTPGNNFFTVTATNGETLNSVIINGNGLSTLGQVRIGGLTSTGGGPGGGGGGAVPEPSTYALLGCGLALMFIGRRRVRA